MSVPTVVIHVELPAYSSSFDVQVREDATVLDVKQAISSTCDGHPQPEGQRVIWRGRCLEDQEKICEIWTPRDEQRTVHLSVRPSAWLSDPLNTDSTTSPSLHSTARTTQESSFVGPRQPSAAFLPTSDLDDSFAFIRFKHSQALSWLSNYKLVAPPPLVDLVIKRNTAKLSVERLGYTWPDVLDTTPPLASPPSTNTLDYRIITLDNKPYLSLQTPRGTPSPLQVHALSVLTYTFSILAMPSPPAPPTPTSVPDTSSVPPHVNDLLQELGLPPLRAVPNANINVDVQPDAARAPAAAENPEGNVIREIPIRALLAPLLMIVFRTVLLLYFFSPTRKPLLGLCLIAWIIYEMWTHVRIVILRPLDRAGRNGEEPGANGAQAGRAADAPPAAAPAAQDGDHVVDRNPQPQRREGRVLDPEPTRDAQQVQGPPIPRQSNGIIDNLALTNVHSENKLLWPIQRPATIPEPPTFLHKLTSFFSLLVVTLHPEVYNRRRAALRQREGRLRTEINAMQWIVEPRGDRQELSEEERKRDALGQQLQAQHAQRAMWVKQYVERVRRDDWVEE